MVDLGVIDFDQSTWIARKNFVSLNYLDFIIRQVQCEYTRFGKCEPKNVVLAPARRRSPRMLIRY